MLVLLASLAHGAPQSPVASRDTLWDTYLRTFEPLTMPDDGTDPPFCATTLVEMIKLRWNEFTPTEQAQITSHVAPFLPELTAPLMPRANPVNGQLPPPGGNDTCWGAYLENQVQGDHFSVEWQDGTITQSEALDFLDELEHAYDVEVDQLGWRKPVGIDDYLMPVYVVEGWSASAYTTVNPYACGGYYLPYVVAYEGSFYGGTWWMDMAAHEFNHSSQFAYGYAMEFWYWEATATYVQEYVYPDHNVWSDYITGYSEQPYIAMSASDQANYDIFYHMYGMAIWNFWIDENYGGMDTILDIWEFAAGEPGTYSVSQADAIDGIGLEFADVFKGFTAANTVMDYREQSSFPSINDQDDVSDLPAEGESASATAPEAFGSNYIAFDLDAPTGDKKDLEFTFDGAEPANWLVQLVGAVDERVVTTIEVNLLESTGTGRLENYGQYDQIFAVISPRKDAAGDFDYAWSAAGALPLVPEVLGDTGAADGTGGTTDGPTVETEGGGLFGCDATGAAAPLGWAGLVAALGLRRRRSK